MYGLSTPRPCIPFSAVNSRSRPGHDPNLQRHHLLPRQLRNRGCFARMFGALGTVAVGLEDFRRNGLLLPAREPTALRMGLPLHRGPHRVYSELVAHRVGQVERAWSSAAGRDSRRAREEALMRLVLLQQALRRRLLDTQRRRLVLNRRDPLGKSLDFSRMDALAETLWSATQPMNLPSSSTFAA